MTEDHSEDDVESEEDITQLRKALNTAKEVLHSVDTAIRTAENEHRSVIILGGKSMSLVRIPAKQLELRVAACCCNKTTLAP